jgi:hypothetical protein
MEKPSTKFEDVGGMKRVKEISIKIIQPLQILICIKHLVKTGGSILLYGPRLR